MQTIQTNMNNKTNETHDQPLIQPGEGGEILEPHDLDVVSCWLCYVISVDILFFSWIVELTEILYQNYNKLDMRSRW